MSVRRRLERLEARRPPSAPPVAKLGGTTLDEIRALEADIRRLEAEIRAEGGASLVEPEPPGVLPGDLEAIQREIAALEQGVDPT